MTAPGPAAPATPAAAARCTCGPATGKLPPRLHPHGMDWTCSVCGKPRKYCEQIAVSTGGTIGRCPQCIDNARRERKGRRIGYEVLRWVTETVCVAGDYRDVTTYKICDGCADYEVAKFGPAGADVIDGRDRQRPEAAAHA